MKDNIRQWLTSDFIYIKLHGNMGTWFKQGKSDLYWSKLHVTIYREKTIYFTGGRFTRINILLNKEAYILNNSNFWRSISHPRTFQRPIHLAFKPLISDTSNLCKTIFIFITGQGWWRISASTLFQICKRLYFRQIECVWFLIEQTW